MFDSVRDYVIDEITIPAGWRVVPEQRIPPVIDRETVIVKHVGVERLPEAPIGHLRHELVVAVFVPNQDLARAEDRLDQAVTEIMTELDGHPKISWTRATKVVTPDGLYPGWEIEVTVLSQKDAPTPTPDPVPPVTPDPESE